MILINKYEIIEANVEGDKYTRIYDKFTKVLRWESDFKSYIFKDNKWMLVTKRKGFKKYLESCWLEDEYKKYIRIEKIKTLIDD